MYRAAASRIRVPKGQARNRFLTRFASSSAVAAQSTSGGIFSWFTGGSSSSLPPLDFPLKGIELPPSLPDHVETGKTIITTLSNGVRIASESSANPAASIGLYVNSGSIYETPASFGATHLLERMAFKSTANRSHLRLVREVEAVGGNVAASASREQMSYSFDALKTYVPQMVELLVDSARNQVFLDWEVKEQIQKVKAEISEYGNNPEGLLLEAVHSAGYSGALGNALIATEASINRLDSSILEEFVAANYTAPRIVLAASGVEHEELLKYAEPLLSDLPGGAHVEEPKSVYVGGDHRVMADSGRTSFALAFELPGGWLKEKDAMTLTVLQILMGGGGSFSAGGPGKGMYSRLYLRVLNEYPEIQSFSAFSSVYTNSAIFGIQATTIPEFASRLSFINKLDRTGADPWVAITQLRDKLGLNAVAMQVPIGLEQAHCGVVDLIKNRAFYFEGYKGVNVREADIPAYLAEEVAQKRNELIERVGNEDEKLGEWMIENDYPKVQPPEELLKEAIRKQTIERKLVPVFMGAAFKNIGVQPLLDGVIDFLPNPAEVENMGIDATDPANEKPVKLLPDPKLPLVGLAFKLEEGRFGQVTFLRIYQGSLKRGDVIMNANSNKPSKVPRLVKMHANELEEINEASAGEICALFGVECYSGNTFTTQGLRYLMTSMHVPEPVISLSITPIKKDNMANFNKALTRFQKEDPTFRVRVDQDSGQTIISGMGELHLQIYSERLKREYGVENITGKPLVSFRETIGSVANFDYTHKKQSGGAGQYARVAGCIEPLPKDYTPQLEFVDETVGGSIPPHFMEAVRKGFLEGCEKGPMLGQAVQGIRFVVKDGAFHAVDSSDLAFRICAAHALRDAIRRSQPVILEPIMSIEVQAPIEFQGDIITQLNKRRGIINDTEQTSEFTTIKAEVPLNNMFGYSTEVRSATQGKAEFSMEYMTHEAVPRDQMHNLISEYNANK